MFCTKCGASVSGSFCGVCGTPVAQAPPPPPAAAPPSPTPSAPGSGGTPPPVVWDYATWATRVLGYLIDSLLVSVVLAVLLVLALTVFGGLIGLGGGLHWEGLEGLSVTGCCCLFSLVPLAILLIGLWNKVYLVAQRGYSVGQGVMGIKVVDAQGQLLSQGTALIRLLAHVGLSFIPFGGIIDLLWPLWDDRRQTLHDKAVGCYVITDPARR
jgi:uncharacterized RDD family membrane protein YckC